MKKNFFKAKCISEELCECVENGLNNEKSIYFYDLSSEQFFFFF